MTNRLKGECDMQTPGQTTHGRPNDESSAKSWKNSGSIGNDSSGLPGSRPKGKRIARGYKTQGLEGMDSLGLKDSGSRRSG